MPWMSKKNDQHGLDMAANFTRFFRPRWIWRSPLRRLLLSLRVITIHPCFITGYDIGDEVGVVSGLLFEFPADRNAKGLLVVAQQPWHKCRRNASHVHTVRQNALNGPVWQSYYLTNIVDSLPTICKDSVAKFCNVFRCCACRRSSERSSSSTDVRPFLKCLYHKRVLLWLMAFTTYIIIVQLALKLSKTVKLFFSSPTLKCLSFSPHLQKLISLQFLLCVVFVKIITNRLLCGTAIKYTAGPRALWRCLADKSCAGAKRNASEGSDPRSNRPLWEHN